MEFESGLAYCGIPPVQGSASWNMDPVLWLVLGLTGLAYVVGARRADLRPSRRERVLFASGWLIIAACLVSPLCNLSVALFSARVTQHMLILLVGVPLVAASRPERLLPAAWRAALIEPRAGERLLAAPLFAAVLWLWHVGRPYDLTLESTPVYWLMHASLILAAWSLWRGILFAPPLIGVAMSFFAGLQMTGLGALLVFATAPLFSAHLETALAWGYTPLEDQQLGGLIMWIPAGLLLVGHALAVLGVTLHGLGERAQPYHAPERSTAG